MKKKLLALMMGTTLVLAACGGGGDEASGGSETASGSDPEKLYNQKCSGCHGGDLKGLSGPDLSAIGSKLSQEEIEGVIANGQGNMPGGLFEGEEASSLAEWLAGKK